MILQEYGDEKLQALLSDAYFQMGKVLYMSEDYDRAVSFLGDAVQRDPQNIAAHYYLGQAIRALVENNFLKRAEAALRTYLEQGAPIGHEDEVRQFLGTRQKAK